jgi:hypothetical protein
MPAAEKSGQTDADQPGDFRIGEDGKVEVFDGVDWRPYKTLPEPPPGPILREEPPNLP